jgi:hypothetical protein
MSMQWFGEHVGQHLVSGEVPQFDCPRFHVVLEEVPLRANVFDLLAGQGILRVRDGVLVVLQDCELEIRIVYNNTSKLDRMTFIGRL